MTDIYTGGELHTAEFKLLTGLLKASTGEDGKRRIKGIASSTIQDRHGDRMERTALKDMERAANDNMTIFVNHSYQVPEDVVGSVESAVLRRRQESDDEGNPIYDLEMTALVAEGNPRAVKTADSIEAGVKLGFSIGAMIPKGGATYDEEANAFRIHHVDLLETSVVSIPANPRSWIGGAVKALRQGNGLDSLDNRAAFEKALAPDEPEADEPEAVTSGDEPDSTIEVTAPVETAAADEPTSQEASPDAGPENEEGAVSTPAEASADLDIEDSIDPSVLSAAGAGVQALLLTMAARLETAVAELDEEKRARAEVETQRDEILEGVAEVISQVQQIVDEIAKTPMGRKTSFVEATEQFEHLRGVYSDRFLRLLSAGERSQ